MITLILASLAFAASPEGTLVDAGANSLYIGRMDRSQVFVTAHALERRGTFDLAIDIEGDGVADFVLRPGYMANVGANAHYINSRCPALQHGMCRFDSLELRPGTEKDGFPVAIVKRGSDGQLVVSMDFDRDGSVDAEGSPAFGW